MRKSLLTVAAASLVASTTVAQAAPVVDVRDAAPIAQAEALSGDDGEGTTIIPIILGVAALIALLLLTGDDEEDEAPFSP